MVSLNQGTNKIVLRFSCFHLKLITDKFEINYLVKEFGTHLHSTININIYFAMQQGKMRIEKQTIVRFELNYPNGFLEKIYKYLNQKQNKYNKHNFCFKIKQRYYQPCDQEESIYDCSPNCDLTLSKLCSPLDRMNRFY